MFKNFLNKKLIIGGALSLALIGLGYLLYNPTPQTLEDLIGVSEYTKLNLDKPLKDQKRRIKIGDRTFEIPIMYISGPLKDGEEQTGVNIRYVMPDYTSTQEFKTQQEHDQAFRDGRYVEMLAQVPDKKMPFNELIEVYRARGDLSETRQAEHGLERYSHKVTSPTMRQRDDIYIERDAAGNVVSRFMCSPDGRDRVPGCTHYFFNQGLHINIHYNKEKYLKDWRSMREGAIQFLKSIEIRGV